ncbi:MAG: JAB domain-containing protein [Gammaproteobacteria bacterium]|nr:JAB domain-containing protein [Gammaproteobacteria bacterium]
MNRTRPGEWRPTDRPRQLAAGRQRLLAAEQDALSDADLLAVLLRGGAANASAIDVANRLLDRFGAMHRVLDAPAQELLSNPGLGPTRVASLKAVLPITARYAASRMKEEPTFGGSNDASMFLMGAYAGVEREVFGCLFLDARNRMLCFEKLFFGTVDRADVSPREVAKAALKCNAAAVIFAHNHPSGVPEPSVADIHLTDRLVAILKELDVEVLDHVVIGGNQTVSMAERGMIATE